MNKLAYKPSMGLSMFFGTEMWERYGFYIVQSLLALYLSLQLHMKDAQVYMLVGSFTALTYISPIIGGWIVKLLDWRSIFLFVFSYTVLLLWICYKKLPETLPQNKRQAFNLNSLAKSYKQILRSPLFHLKSGTIACNFAGLFLYISAAPTFLPKQLGLGPDQFAWLFFPFVSGIFLGALAANRLAGKIKASTQVLAGFSFLIGSGIINVTYHCLFPPSLPWSVVPLFFYAFGMSMIAPIATLMVLDLFPDIRGLAASCQAFVQTMLAALVAGVMAPFLAHSVLWLAAGQLTFGITGLILWLGRRAYREPARTTI